MKNKLTSILRSVGVIAFVMVAVSMFAGAASADGVHHGITTFDSCKSLATWDIDYQKQLIDGQFLITEATVTEINGIGACEGAKVTLEALYYADPVTNETTKSATGVISDGNVSLDFSGANSLPITNNFDLAITIVS